MKIQHWIAGLAFMGVGCVEASHLEERTSAAAMKQGALPEIYLIGDSIRIGYCKDVARELEGKADVRWPDCNCANSQNILINLGWWRKFASSPAVVQFNCGHWDSAHWDGDDEPVTSVSEYQRNVRLVIRRLRRYYPDAVIVYTTTTPMNPAGVTGGNPRTTEEIRRYNAAGVVAAKAEGAVVNDLFAATEHWPASDYADYCHFTPAANARLGRLVAERLLALAGGPSVAGVDIVPGDIHAKDLCPLDAGGAVAGDPIVVVKDGLARFCVVWAEDESARWAADQLQETVFEMTGVRLPVVVERAGQSVTNAPAFYIGQTAAARKAGLVAPQDHAEAFRVVSRDGSLYFLGKADFAVTDWCERQLGARFYWPMRPSDVYGGKGTNLVYGKCVVKTRGLAVCPVDWEDRPVYSYRDNYPYEGVAWNRWGKGGRSHRGGVNVHAPHGWWKEPDAQDHLEIFALSEDGKRPTSPLLCYGNPKTVEYYEKRTREGIDAYAACADKRVFKDPSGGILNYAQKVVTISQWDCGVACACDHCKRLFNERLGASGSGSPIIWGFFTKQYAKWMKANYPDWKICILPYVNTCDVPPDPEDPSRPLSLREEGNVEAMLCTMPGLAMLKNEACRRHEEELIRQWVACTGNPVLNWHYSCWPAEFTSAPFVYGETIRRHYQNMGKDLVGTFINGVYDIERLSLSGYVWMRCLWNPNVDVQAVYDGFATRMFGRAAKPMRKLIAMQEDGWNRQWGSDMCSVKNVYEISYPRKEAIEMSALLDEAMELAADDEIAKARIAWYRKGFERFFRESEENASGTAFAPHLMKKAAGMPKIDGRLDDTCWQVAEMHEWVSAKCRTNSVPQYKTQSRIVWYPGEEGGVVYGLRFEDPAAGQVREGVQGDTWGQDNCEIFIDASGTGDGHFYQLCIDGSCRLTCYTDGIDWKPQGVKIAKAVGEDFWSLEVFLPFKDVRGFPKARIPTTSADGCVWTGNLCRFRVGDALGKTKAPGSKTEMSRLYTRYNTWNKDPAAFGEFRFVE